MRMLRLYKLLFAMVFFTTLYEGDDDAGGAGGGKDDDKGSGTLHGKATGAGKGGDDDDDKGGGGDDDDGELNSILPENLDGIPDNMLKDGKLDVVNVIKMHNDTKAALADANKKLKEGTAKDVPESADDYKFTALEGDDALPADDPAVAWFRGAAHARGLGQEDADSMLNDFLKFAGGLDSVQDKDGNDIEPINADKEFEKLGPQAQGIVDTITGLEKNLVKWGVFNDNDVEEFRIASGTASGMNMMMKMLGHFNAID